jgi:hypothetical protein
MFGFVDLTSTGGSTLWTKYVGDVELSNFQVKGVHIDAEAVATGKPQGAYFHFMPVNNNNNWYYYYGRSISVWFPLNPCADGYGSPMNVTNGQQCAICQDGHYSTGGIHGCRQCPAGTVASGTGNTGW